MVKMIIMALSNMMNINFIKLNHPMSMMMFVIIQTFFVGLITGTMMESFWLSYILFLTFLGGMLVLFIYISSIASNELFKTKYIIMITLMIIMMITTMILIIVDKMMFLDLIKNTETMNINNSINFQEMTMSLEKLYNKPTFIITMMMMIYLFLTLVAVVKITNINQGPIRKMS
uniref:NADH-ubiquinone oxidoreductase chain 6 n=2 Tax=Chorthippus parallelus TaxID=37639 RepID=A0A8F0WF87_CHOPA|nr:NADH dehydrogenase subunit 6 [Chorthippus parallelus parallelus]YP_010133599.1 NADH dehydrogenase subunit 6 [Chorthippus parallelus erythropus]QWM92862.1 NADH dehydrogenase subunit 6 [Chorthippus parallelus parallelus]QWM92889.1 NADH dehydrogenase subunit 6 [Chorthippus parallelus erythropus]QWM92902.1 NADH dehydrogenase subunit 6 [Chorthippus parallelus erythropus]QWM92915.1 NADH dehydrogenase subunit 6 [Chorthippus parallelus erythropus]